MILYSLTLNIIICKTLFYENPFSENFNYEKNSLRNTEADCIINLLQSLLETGSFIVIALTFKHHPFTAEEVTPSMKNFWQNRNAIRIGKSTTVAAAI